MDFRETVGVKFLPTAYGRRRIIDARKSRQALGLPLVSQTRSGDRGTGVSITLDTSAFELTVGRECQVSFKRFIHNNLKAALEDIKAM